MAKSTALAVIEKINLPALNKERLEAVQEEMEGMDPSFDRIRIPSGGGIAFEVPGEDPENPDSEKEVYGVILDHHAICAWWATEYSGENNPPDCASIDGIVGVSRETGEKKACASCPKNQYGSAAEGNGKACKNMRRIYFAKPDYMFPMLLVLPPTSLKNFANYIKRSIVGKGRRSCEVLTRFSLAKDRNAGGIVYSKAVFAPAGMLPENIQEQVKAYAQEIKAFTRTIEVSTEDYGVTEVVTEEDIM